MLCIKKFFWQSANHLALSRALAPWAGAYSLGGSPSSKWPIPGELTKACLCFPLHPLHPQHLETGESADRITLASQENTRSSKK